MGKNSVFTEMCIKLEKQSKLTTESELGLARREVKAYINDEEDKYKQLSAEAKGEASSAELLAMVISTIGFVVTSLTFISTCLDGEKIIVLIGFLIEFVIALVMLNYIIKIVRWRKYILEVMNEFKPEDFKKVEKNQLLDSN